MRAVLLVSAALCLSSWLCEIPVFRFALERWEPEPYTVCVIHSGPLSDADRRRIKLLRERIEDPRRPAKATLHILDAENVDEDTARLLSHHAVPEAGATSLLVLYPPGTKTEQPAWKGPLSAETIERLADSPLRQSIAKRILDGESAVWVLIESGDKEKDDRAETDLRKTLDVMEQHLELPSIEDIQNDEFYEPDTVVKLRLAFDVVRLKTADAAESIFRTMLVRSESDVEEYVGKEPIAVPIFGRGRTYFALVGEGINPDRIEEICQFLIGRCSCTIQKDNPGASLLFAVDWETAVKGSAIPEKKVPELTGIGSYSRAVQGSQSEPEPGAIRIGSLVFPVLLVGLCLAAIGTILMRSRSTSP